ncbi:MAG: hypothetical protein Q8K65_00385 [Alphaproteobacteria bacterium]|nr:hypothetical protein [Alphaproteobacteria bacterium]
MKNMSKMITGFTLLTAIPMTIAAYSFSAQVKDHTPQFVASPVLASLGVTGITNQNVHSDGCNCAACQQGCQIVIHAKI